MQIMEIPQIPCLNSGESPATTAPKDLLKELWDLGENKSFCVTSAWGYLPGILKQQQQV